MRPFAIAVATAVFALAAARGAQAQSLSGVPTETWAKDEWPTAVVERTVTLPAGMLSIPIQLVDYTDAPVYVLSPGLYYGMSDQLTVGVQQHTVHVSFVDFTNSLTRKR